MAVGVRWRKVRGDLGQDRARTALVVASIAIGAFAVGTTAGAEALLRRNLEEGFAATRPAAATLFTGLGFDRELVDVIRGMPGVDDAEGRRSVVVRLLADDGTSREMLLTALPDFEDQRIDLVRRQATTTTSDVTTTLFTLFDTLVLFLSAMAVLLGVVGGLGLAGTMTMNVVERSREIGVIRAVGASDTTVLLLFLAEGLLIGLLAWLIGAALSIPASKVLSDALGQAFVQRPLAFEISAQGLVLWFIVVFWLAVVGSLLPAWRAARTSVREVLAYE